jgi:hypothetical protein
MAVLNFIATHIDHIILWFLFGAWINETYRKLRG